MNVSDLGFLDKGTGKHQSNTVYGTGGLSPTLCAGIGVKYWILILDHRRHVKGTDELNVENKNQTSY